MAVKLGSWGASQRRCDSENALHPNASSLLLLLLLFRRY